MIVVKEIAQDGFVIIIDGSSIWKFKQLVQRATNLWPDAPPEIKEFADLITSGRILQDYRSQDTSASSEEKAFALSDLNQLSVRK